MPDYYGYGGPRHRESDRDRVEDRHWNEPDLHYHPPSSYRRPSRGLDVRRADYSTRNESFVGRGPKGYQRSDTRIREDACDRLADSPFIDASDIEVFVENGEVMLSGTVASRDEKRLTEELVECVSGVRDVHNTLRCRRRPDTSGDGTLSSEVPS